MKKLILLCISICLLTGFTKYQINTFPLLGKSIYIDVGHGGLDPGVVVDTIYEKNINLEVSLKLKKTLIQKGATVYLIREGDYDLATPNTSRRKKSDFDNRIERINSSTVDIYLSIHMNYLEDATQYGPQVFYEGEQNKKLAYLIQESLNTLGTTRSIQETPNIYMYKRLKKKGVLIECGFLSNIEERAKLQDSSYQELLSKKIELALEKYFT